MEFECIKIEKKENIETIHINRPESLNALNTKTLTELQVALNDAKADDNVWVVIITGVGEKAFIAGADIKEMMDKSPMEMRDFAILGHGVMKTIAEMEKPVIAAINGFALGGGCELAISCDMRIASEKAKLGQPEVNLGIFPGFGGTQRLPRLIGKAKASELIFTGDMIDAATAERIGLVNRVVPPDKLMEETEALAKKICSKGQLAVRLAKSAINRGLETDLNTGIGYEIESFGLISSTEDKMEGMKAFIEKRKPDFKLK